MYYKRLIDKVIEEKNKEEEQKKIQQANQKRVDTTKYSIDSVYVGYLNKRAVQKHNGKEVLKQMISPKSVLLFPVELQNYKDIESNNYYPLLELGEYPTNDDNYVSERFLNSFSVMCLETLQAHGIADDAKLTVGELRKIMQEQEILKETYFNL